MLESNYNKDCAFSEQTISYLYDEISLQEKSVFENHLENCLICADEIHGFGLTRSAVSYWKENEFETLNTPKIVFSDGQSQKAIKTSVGAVEKKSWFAGLQTLFQPRTVLAGGLAVFLILGGLVFFIQSFATNNQTAANSGNQEIYNSESETKQAEIGGIEIGTPDLPQTSAQNPSPLNGSKVDTHLAKAGAANSEKIGSVEVNKNFTKTSRKVEAAAPSQNKTTAPRNFGAANFLVSQRVSNNKKRIPKLNDIEIEDEDETSLRLTDLLDEVGGK